MTVPGMFHNIRQQPAEQLVPRANGQQHLITKQEDGGGVLRIDFILIQTLASRNVFFRVKTGAIKLLACLYLVI